MQQQEPWLTVRLFGADPSAVIATLAGMSDRPDKFGWSGNWHGITLKRRPGVEPELWARFVEELQRRHLGAVLSTDGRTVDDLVAGAAHGRRIGVVDLLTGGRIRDRLTSRAGSDTYFAGSIVPATIEAVVTELGLPPELIQEHGAVSEPVVEALANAGISWIGADTLVATIGTAGPGGSTRACLCAMSTLGPALTWTGALPGNRDEVQARGAQIGFHMLRCALTGAPFPLT